MFRYFFICLLLVGSLFCDDSLKQQFYELTKKDFEQIPMEYRQWLQDQTISIGRMRKGLSHKPDYKEAIRKIKKIATFIKKPATVGNLAENRYKNRVTTVIPFDETRTLRHLEGFYISANDMLTPKQAYIVTQAPIELTLFDFWKTILETDTQTIVSLAMSFENNKLKFPAYWDASRFPIRIGNWQISFVSEECVATSSVILDQKIMLRTLKAKNGKDVRIINHIHYENWPDHGCAEHKLFCELLDLVDSVHPDGKKPILVHCAAGIGRSGTFVAAHSLRKEVISLGSAKDNGLINIPRRIIEMRMQRSQMVSSSAQLQSIHDAIFDMT